MVRIMLITFAALGWAWFELSGGTEFVPGGNGVEVFASFDTSSEPTAPSVAVQPEPEVQPQLVARSETVNSDFFAVKETEQSVNVTAAVENAVQSVVDAKKSNTIILGSETEATQVAAVLDYRVVTGSRVNLRAGPSTSFDVVTKLVRGDEVEVLQENADGWVELRSLAGNFTGWMAADFLIPVN